MSRHFSSEPRALLATIPDDPLAAFALADHLERQDDPQVVLQGELLRLTYALTRRVGGEDRSSREDRLRALMKRGVRPIGPRARMNLGGGTSLDFVWVPPGAFLMGSPEDEPGRPELPRDDPDCDVVTDWPRHEVVLTRGFWMGTTPVTQSQYARVTGSNPSWKSHNVPDVEPRNRDRPVQEVRWCDAVAFLEKLSGRSGGFRLPTEAEWEYACRAGTTSRFWSGNDEADLERVGWCETNSVDESRQRGTYAYGPDIQPVGLKPANPWGLRDVHGNVWEWCVDRCDETPARPTSRTDPFRDDVDSGKRVIRGGDAWDEASNCRSAARDGWSFDASHNDLGFRVVADRRVFEILGE